jgi:predicted ATPase/class 3 adenylate cyclase
MAELPTGTVTFLFTDIEGSTRLQQRVGPAYAAVRDTHHQPLRAAIAAYDGVEVDTQGDAFFVAFPTAPAAVAAACEATRALAASAWPEGGVVRVRMGLHTGAPLRTPAGYVGLDVVRAARIASSGHGGQILLSEATRALVEDALPEGATLRDLGAYRFKDLLRPERLTQVVLSGLPADFPPLKSLDTYLNNLPIQSTPLLGREEQVAALSVLLRRDDVRLVTLTGPGGIGKTRLAVQVAADLLDDFPDGVWFVRLARLTDPALVLPTIAQTLGLREQGGAQLAETLEAHLGAKRLLLVLDNFEQVVEAAPALSELLAACPGVTALVTSRVPLHLHGEREYALRPLALPDPTHLPPLATLTQYAAVALFIERAQAAQADFSLTNHNAPAVAEICARLDGLPLAIELAAARVKLLPPPALLQRLERALPLLTGGARDRDARQQTMRATLAWSEDLLTPEQQRLFQRLAVFVSGWTLAAAEAVCAAPDGPEGAEPLGLDMLDGLGALVDQSLVQRQAADQRDQEGAGEGDEGEESEDGGEPRFSMLHVIREFALERLVASGEAEARAVRQAHLGFFLADVERVAQAVLATPPPPAGLRKQAFRKLAPERDNLRAALDWACADGDLALGFRLLAIMASFTTITHLSELRGWAERLLARASLAGSPGSAGSAGSAGDAPLTSDDAFRVPPGLVLAHDANDTRLSVLLCAAGWAFNQNQLEQAADLYARTHAWALALGDARAAAGATQGLGWVAMAAGDLARGASVIEAGIAQVRQLGNELKAGQDLANFAYFLLTQANDDERASVVATEALAIGRQTNYVYSQIFAGATLAMVAARRDEVERARELARDALRRASAAGGDAYGTPLSLYALAMAESRGGRSQRAARLLGAADAMREQRGIALSESETAIIEPCMAPARAALGEEAWAAAFAAGRALSLEQAIAEALDEGSHDA